MSIANTRLSHGAQLMRARVEAKRESQASLEVGCEQAMEANEMERRTWDEGGQALQEFQRAYHQR